MARNDFAEIEDQLMSRYFQGMHTQFQDVLNMFDHISVLQAHQKALQYEKQLGRHGNNGGFGYSNVGEGFEQLWASATKYYTT